MANNLCVIIEHGDFILAAAEIDFLTKWKIKI
jgi:hypothetical protein